MANIVKFAAKTRLLQGSMTNAALLLTVGIALVATGCRDDDGTNENVEYTDWGDDLPEAGNPNANCPVPDDAIEEDVSTPDHVIGDGTPESCTSAAVVEAIAQGGAVTFDCGPEPVTIVMQETAEIFNDTGPDIVIDGGPR